MKTHMCRTVLLASTLLAGCMSTSVELAPRGCLPAGIPGTVTLQRQVYLYRGKRISMTDYIMDREVRREGTRSIRENIPPLRVLPPGTKITILSVTRNNGFDAIETTQAHGIVEGDAGDVPFDYIWGIADRIDAAPWESAVYAPRETRRLLCGNMPPGFTDP